MQEAGKTLKERFPAKMKEARVELPSGSLAPGALLCGQQSRMRAWLRRAQMGLG